MNMEQPPMSAESGKEKIEASIADPKPGDVFKTELGVEVLVEDVGIKKQYLVRLKAEDGELSDEEIWSADKLQTILGRKAAPVVDRWDTGRTTERDLSPFDLGFQVGDEVFGDPEAETRIGDVVQADHRPKYQFMGYSPKDGEVLLHPIDEEMPAKTVSTRIFAAANHRLAVSRWVGKKTEELL